MSSLSGDAEEPAGKSGEAGDPKIGTGSWGSHVCAFSDEL